MPEENSSPSQVPGFVGPGVGSRSSCVRVVRHVLAKSWLCLVLGSPAQGDDDRPDDRPDDDKGDVTWIVPKDPSQRRGIKHTCLGKHV